MALLALCLVSVLTPQDPAPAVNAPMPSVTPAVTTQASDGAATLAKLETAGSQADPMALARLTRDTDQAIASRASWLLARRQDRPALQAMQTVVVDSPHADARTHAMQGALRFGDAASTATAITALGDSDRRVRTFAAQLLGKLKRPAANDPLLGLIESSRTTCEPGIATDLQAALLALHDLGAGDCLLRVATALHDSKAEGTGSALAFYCQGLALKLEPSQQVTFLLAVLGHREPLVRRFAIGRLAELRDATSVKALEGRLATETDELRPLVELALAQVRNDKPAPPVDEMARATQNLRAIASTLQAQWQALLPWQQGATVGGVVLMLLAIVLMRRRSRAARDAAAAAATMALVAPSDEYVAEAEAEAEQLAAQANEVVEPMGDAEFVDNPDMQDEVTVDSATPADAEWQDDAAGRR